MLPSFSQAHLAAGDYQLYLFADQSPIHVASSLTGLTGSATLAPTVHLPIEVVTPAPAIPRTDPLTAYYSAGVRRTFSGAGAGALMSLGFDASVPGHVETVYGTCAFREEPLPRSIGGPGCPKRGLGGPSGSVIEDGTITANRYQGYAFAAFVRRRVRGRSGSTSSTRADDEGGLVLRCSTSTTPTRRNSGVTR